MLENCRLLIMDDENEIRQLIRQVAEDAGYEVKHAESEAEFKTLYKSFAPTFIFMDLVMPDINSMNLVRYLADIQSKSKIVVMSGYGQDYVSNVSRLASRVGLPNIIGLNKPFSLKTLRDLLEFR